MSATGRGGLRQKDDTYYTPDALALECVRVLSRDCMRAPIRVLEPSAGGGAFVRAATRIWPRADVCSIDVHPHPSVELVGRFEDEQRRGWDLILGNPPYALAESFIRHAVDLLAPVGVLAFLLRVNFLGSRARSDLWRAHPLSSLYVIRPRPSFTNGGSDATEYAWFVWGGAEHPVRWLDWNNGKRRRAP